MSLRGQPGRALREGPPSPPHRPRRAARRIGWIRWVIAAGVPVAFLVVPPLSDLPARLVAGCTTWVGLAALLELASVLGFVVAFALVFGNGLTPREWLVAGLRALGASTILPGGSLVGPAVAVRSMPNGPGSLRRLAVPTIASVVLTSAPGVAVLALAGIGLWLGWPDGPHGPLLTLAPAGVALAVLAATWLLGRTHAPAIAGPRANQRSSWTRWLSNALDPLRAGVADARRLLRTRDPRLLGAAAYYVFDNAVLWAAFRAYGSTPPLGVLVMGYLVGSLGSALPTPAGIGAVEGGLIGALVLYGAPLAPAVAATLLYRGISLGLAVALGGCGWVCRPRSARTDGGHRSGKRSPTSASSIIVARRISSMPRRPSAAATHPSE